MIPPTFPAPSSKSVFSRRVTSAPCFAAVRAARLGARVAIVEQAGAFGGTATNSFVCIWHSLTDDTYKKQIISGLTEEMIERLKVVPNGLRIRPPMRTNGARHITAPTSSTPKR